VGASASEPSDVPGRKKRPGIEPALFYPPLTPPLQGGEDRTAALTNLGACAPLNTVRNHRSRDPQVPQRGSVMGGE